MKIRRGFVSNSSSSSFVIDYYKDKKEKVHTKDDVMKHLQKLVELEQLSNPNIKFEDIFNLKLDNADDMCIGKKDDDIILLRKKWEKDNKETDFAKVKGKIIINSKEDNSIPVWMRTYLEDRLNALWWHWG